METSEDIKDIDKFFEEKRQGSADRLRGDVKLIYEEIQTDIRTLAHKINQIKPVLKIDDPETEKFIRSVLSKQDHLIRTQQTAIEEKLLMMRNIESKVDSRLSDIQRAVKAAEEADAKFKFVEKTLNAIQEQTTKPKTFIEKVKFLFSK